MLYAFIATVILVNVAVWLVYRRRLERQDRQQEAKLDNCYAYISELQTRSERYRVAMLTEALAAKTRTQPVVKVYPIQRSGAYWVIESNLN